MSNYPYPNNPYQSPYGGYGPGPYGYGQKPPSNPSRLVMPVAICLIVVYAFSLLCFIILIPASIAMRTAAPPRNISQSEAYMAGQFMGFAVILIVNGVGVAGAVQMLRMRTYALAMTTSVLAVIPICSACYVLGIPFGIWAIVVLCQPHVRRAFAD